MNITIKTIPHKKQRYKTCGDWRFDKNGNLLITISDVGNWEYEALVAVHELIEVILCKKRGISEHDVTNFDLDNINSDEPGFIKDSPYYKEHQVADVVERLLANQLGINWEAYSDELDKLP